MNFLLQYDATELKRKEALRSQDARVYRAMCDEIGIRQGDLEDRTLYEQGIAEEQFWRARVDGEDQRGYEKYTAFLKGARHVVLSDFERQWQTKKKLLERYFPEQFGRDGQQPLSRFQAGQIGKIFKRVYKHGEKLLDEKNSAK